MLANILSTDPSPSPCCWGQNSPFSEHYHVAYQIKENHKCSYMVVNVLPVGPIHPPDPGDEFSRAKFFFFSEHCQIAYYIKENHECNDMKANIMRPDP